MFYKKLKKQWFQDSDGTFYRNGLLIMSEMDVLLARSWYGRSTQREFSRLQDELAQAWENTLCKDTLGPNDVVIKAISFREAYPRHPELWAIDDLPR